MHRSPAGRARGPVVAGALVLVCLAAPSGGALAQDASPAGDPLVVATWASYVPPTLAGIAADELSRPLEVRAFGSDRELADALLAGEDPGVDLAIVSAPVAQELGRAGKLAPIDAAAIPNLANLFPEATNLPTDPGNTLSVPYSWGTAGLCYRADLVAQAPDSWADVLTPAPEDAGRVTLLADDRWLLVPALRTLGRSVNTTDGGDLDRARDLLVAARDAGVGFDATTFHDRLIDGTIAIAEAWDGWCGYAMADKNVGDQVRFAIPAEGSAAWADVMVIPATSPDVAAAQALIDAVLRPEVHAWVPENVLYGVPDQAAMELVAPDLRERFPSLSITPADLLAQELLADVGPDARARIAEIAAAVEAP